MALPKEDEMLLAGLYDQATARRGGRSGSPSLNRMQSFDPAINPPPAPRNVTPAALTPTPAAQPVTPTPMTRVGRAGIQTPVVGGGSAGPRFQQGLPGSGGAGRGRTTLQTAPTPLSIMPDAQGKTLTGAASAPATATNPLNPLNGNTATAIPRGAAAALPSSASVLSAAEQPPATPLSNITQTGRRSFSGPDTVTLADARALPDIGKKGGGLSVIGMGLSPEATLAKLKDQTAAVQGLNRNKSTGMSDAELAKVDARRAKDSEIFQLTQAGHSLPAASAFVAKRDAALAQQTAESPEQSALNQQALLKGGQGLQQGALDLEKGGAELQKGRQMQSMLTELHNLDPNKPESKARGESIIQQILLGQEKYTQPVAQKSLGYGTMTDPITGEMRTYSKDTGGIDAPAAQGGAQPTQAHLSLLQQNRENPEAIAAFEAQYGPGSAARYLTPAG